MKEKKIPGIYNYCDRWCERCRFTSRCFTYAPDDDADESEEPVDSFLEEVVDNMVMTLDVLRIKEAEGSITLDEDRGYELKITKADQVLRTHELILLTREYSNKALDLLEKSPGFREKQLRLVKEMKMGVKTKQDTLEEVGEISDCLEQAQYYVHFLYAKFHRALKLSLQHKRVQKGNMLQRECDGSAKLR